LIWTSRWSAGTRTPPRQSTPASLTSTVSIVTGGGWVFRDADRGSTETTPLWVGNQRRPSGVRATEGWRPPLHSAESMPSCVP
jgi:hypothetical protein